jgi:hypothetical protein
MMGRVFRRKDRKGWWVSWIDEHGRKHQQKAGPRKALALELLRKKEAEVLARPSYNPRRRKAGGGAE